MLIVRALSMPGVSIAGIREIENARKFFMQQRPRGVVQAYVARYLPKTCQQSASVFKHPWVILLDRVYIGRALLNNSGGCEIGLHGYLLNVFISALSFRNIRLHY